MCKVMFNVLCLYTLTFIYFNIKLLFITHFKFKINKHYQQITITTNNHDNKHTLPQQIMLV